MALTQPQWYAKLKTWVPSWFYENPKYQDAHLQAIAEVLAAVQADIEDQQMQTFIMQSEGSYLDLHGNERNVERLSGEFDPAYAPRVQLISNSSNKPALQALVNLLLINGTATITEDFESALFLDRDIYLNRGSLLLEMIYNAFSIVVDNQKHSPFSFLDREYFMDREDFIGTAESPDELFNQIIAAVNKSKAFGVLYRLLERAEA